MITDRKKWVSYGWNPNRSSAATFSKNGRPRDDSIADGNPSPNVGQIRKKRFDLLVTFYTALTVLIIFPALDCYISPLKPRVLTVKQKTKQKKTKQK